MKNLERDWRSPSPVAYEYRYEARVHSQRLAVDLGADDTSAASSLEAHRLGAFQSRVISDENIERCLRSYLFRHWKNEKDKDKKKDKDNKKKIKIRKKDKDKKKPRSR